MTRQHDLSSAANLFDDSRLKKAWFLVPKIHNIAVSVFITLHYITLHGVTKYLRIFSHNKHLDLTFGLTFFFYDLLYISPKLIIS